jgi:hypothetical protein
VDSVEKPFKGRDYYHYGYDSISKHNNRLPSDVVGRQFAPERKPREEREKIDSVTIGSTFKYFVLPDIDVHFMWYDLDSTIVSKHDTTNLNARFIWWASHTGLGGNKDSLYHPKFSDIAPGITQANQKTPFHIVQWNRLSSLNADHNPDTLYVYEAAGDLFDFLADTAKTPIRVINKPSVSFVDTLTTETLVPYFRIACPPVAPTTTPYSFYFRYKVKSDVAGQKYQKIAYTVVKIGTPPALGDTVFYNVPENGIDSIYQEFADYGVYKVRLLDVSDRISRKSGVAGSPLLEPSPLPPTKPPGKEFTIVIAPPPQLTEPAYRAPNRKK